MIIAVFVLPFAVYCFILGLINRRQHPLLVPGAWDFAGVLLAASGLLALGGPAILTGLSERWRMFWLVGRSRGQDLVGDGAAGLWPLLAAGYFLAVVAGSAYLVWRRRRHSAVYNIEAPVFEEVFAAVLDELGLAWSRSGDQFFLGRPEEGAAGPLPYPAGRGSSGIAGETGTAGRLALDPRAGERRATTAVTVDAAPLLRHVTLRWDGRDAELRGQVERELVQVLGQVRTRSNPMGRWLLLGGAFLIGFAFMGVAVMVLARILGR